MAVGKNSDNSENQGIPIPQSINSASSSGRVSFSQSLPTSLSSLPIASIRPPITKEFQSATGWTFKSVRSSISSAIQVET